MPNNPGRLLAERQKKYIEAINRIGSDNSADVKYISDILDRYLFPWSSNNSIKVQLPEMATSIPGAEGLSIVDSMIKNPHFFRLNHVKQLGLVHLSAHVDGSHNRFSHCLGTAQCAWFFLKTISSQFQSEGRELDPLAEKAVLIAAISHDCFHGPFGHSLELLRDIFAPPTAVKRLDKYYLSAALNEQGGHLNDCLMTFLPREGERKQVTRYLQFFNNVERNIKEKSDSWSHENYYLSQILSSSFDADRVDYVLRDCMHMQQDSLAASTMEDIISKVRVMPVKDNNLDAHLHTLCFALEDKPLITQFLEKRGELYRKYYETPEKLVADDMLAHAVYYILKERTLIPRWEKEDVEDKTKQNIISKLHHLTDWDLVHFLSVIAIKDNDKCNHALLLLSDLLGGRRYKSIDKLDIIHEDISEDVETEFTSLGKEFQKTCEDMHQSLYDEPITPRHDLEPSEKCGVLRDIVRPHSKEIKLLLLAETFGGSGFQKKLGFEHLLWERLLQKPFFFDSYNDYLRRNYGEVGGEKRETLKGMPLVHIAFLNYSATTLKELKSYKTEKAHRGKIAFYDAENLEKEPELQYIDLETAYNKSTTIAVVSVDESLATESNVQMIKDVLSSILFDSLDWLEFSRRVSK